jgi:hypothetical protein
MGRGSSRAPRSLRPSSGSVDWCGRDHDRLQLICLSLGSDEAPFARSQVLTTTPSSPDDSVTAARREYHERLAFEHELINRRLTWLITSPAILFAAYGLSFQGTDQTVSEEFRSVTAWSGITIAFMILVGVMCSFMASAWCGRTPSNPSLALERGLLISLSSRTRR